jgi:hypothetical protein
MRQMESLLRVHRPAIAAALEDMSLKPQFYSFRWLTLLLSQEFKLPGWWHLAPPPLAFGVLPWSLVQLTDRVLWHVLVVVIVSRADVMRIWDTLFSSQDRLGTLVFVCVALLEVSRPVFPQSSRMQP